MAVKKKADQIFLDWIDDPLKKMIAILTAAATLFGLGFTAGDCKKT